MTSLVIATSFDPTAFLLTCVHDPSVCLFIVPDKRRDSDTLVQVHISPTPYLLLFTLANNTIFTKYTALMSLRDEGEPTEQLVYEVIKYAR